MAVAPLPSDKVLVTSLALPVRLLSGDHWSRPSLPAPHLLSFTLHHSLAASGATDTLPSTINYSSASKAVAKVVDGRDWPSLEACAGAAVGELRALGARGQVEVKLEAQKLLVASRAAVEIVSLGEGGPESRSMALSEIVVRCIIGINPCERVEKQLVHLDVSFPLPAGSAEGGGFPHKRLAEEAHDHVWPTSFGTIEALAQSLADHLLAVDIAPHPPLGQVTVRVSKPHALTFAKYASVEVTRARRPTTKAATTAALGPTSSLQAGASSSELMAAEGPTQALIALGSNIGDRVGHINRAVDLLIGEAGNEGLHQTRLLQTSWLYESEPMYVEDQARFVNGAILVSSAGLSRGSAPIDAPPQGAAADAVSPARGRSRRHSPRRRC
jgi:dihydroneopterin aldolase/2-amino-4-hydroxy-6-hydroxymethyldihydropteridine diphosphokinase/dihydropteroate synthase